MAGLLACPAAGLAPDFTPVPLPSETARSVPEDQALLAELKSGGEVAFTAFVRRHHPQLVRVALAFVPSRAVAEEVAQETWVAVLEGLESFEGRSSVRTWLFRILANRAKTRGVRERRSVPAGSLGLGESEDSPAVAEGRFGPNGHWAVPPRAWQEESADQVLSNRRAVASLLEALSGLPESQRAVVTLRDVEGLDAAEVCSVLGITETNQRVLLHRGRSKLRAFLEAHMGAS
jgi:RNA polymerase sigma-70 factor (ECF subfamily)